MSNIYQTFNANPWGGSYGSAYQAPAAPTAAAAPASPGFPATGVPSPGSFSLPTGGTSTSPWAAFTGQNINNIGSQVGSVIPQAESAALPYYTSGIGALQQYYGQAARPFQELYNAAQPGVNLYAGAMGLGGPAEQQAAINAFMASPALQSQLKLGNAATTAQQAATGGTGSGNELLALAKQNELIGQQMWPSWLQGLQPYLQQQQMAGAGLSGVRQGLGQGVSGGLNTIGGMMYGAPMTGLNYLTQADVAAQNAASANMAALTGLGSGLLSAGGLLGGAALLSDVNAKENIEPIGKLADDQTVYRYNYKGDPTPHIGLLAQEVERTVPEAVGEFADGYKGVNYAMATNRAAQLMKFANDNTESSMAPMVYGAGLMELAA